MTDAERAANDATLERFAAEYAGAWTEIRASIFDGDHRKIATGFGGSLIVADCDVVVEEGRVKIRSVLLTEDGKTAITGVWHTGDANGDSVYVERWEGPSHRTFHGYVDPVTRLLVQTG